LDLPLKAVTVPPTFASTGLASASIRPVPTFEPFGQALGPDFSSALWEHCGNFV
jgi:hypothetical protein